MRSSTFQDKSCRSSGFRVRTDLPDRRPIPRGSRLSAFSHGHRRAESGLLSHARLLLPCFLFFPFVLSAKGAFYLQGAQMVHLRTPACIFWINFCRHSESIYLVDYHGSLSFVSHMLERKPIRYIILSYRNFQSCTALIACSSSSRHPGCLLSSDSGLL